MSDGIAKSDDGAQTYWRWVRRAVAAAALIVVLFVLWSAWDREAIMAWKEDAGPLLFFASMAVLPALGVPISPFFILAGATYGLRLGLLGSGIALAANLAMSYWVARGMQGRLDALLRRFGYELPDFAEKERGAVRFTLAVKLAPGVPAFVKNYGLGVAGVPFAIYFVMSMVITGAYAALLIVLGESILEHRLGRALWPAVTLVVVGLGLWLWRRRGQSRRGDDAVASPMQHEARVLHRHP